MSAVIIIYGPTAVGKSSVAIELAKLTNGEIISADSMQLYKYLNIGSAKVTKAEMQGIPHHLLDFLEPDEDYSASNFCTDCERIIDDIIQRGKTPIIVGGTGLYIKGLTDGYSFGETEKNVEFRENVEKLSCEDLYNLIIEKDKDIIIDKNNKHRLIRALERLTFGDNRQTNKNVKYNFKLFAICDDRAKIYERINLRVDKMITAGLLDEAKFILNLNLNENALCMKAIGYKELFPYLKGEDSLENCKEVLKQKTRNYAKRQFTFMNQFQNLTKVNFCGVKETANEIYNIIKRENNGSN